jgi:hypothetical protein
MRGCIWYTYQSAAAAMLGRSTTPPYLQVAARPQVSHLQQLLPCQGGAAHAVCARHLTQLAKYTSAHIQGRLHTQQLTQ